MIELPAELHQRCRDAIGLCDELNSHEELRAVFVAELQAFQQGLPETKSRKERVSRTIAHLLPRRVRGGRFALPLLLEQLAQRQDEGDELHDRLLRLRDEVELELARQAPPVADDQLAALVLLPDSGRAGARGVGRVILDTVQAAGFQPVIDEPRGAGNLSALLQAEVVVADLTDLNRDLLFSLGIAMTLHERVILLFGDDVRQLPRALGGEACILYANEIGMEDDLRERLGAALSQLAPGNVLWPGNTVRQAMPEELRSALRNPTRLQSPADTLQAVLSEQQATRSDLVQMLEQVRSLVELAGEPKAVNTTLQQVADLRARLEEMIAKHHLAEEQARKFEQDVGYLVRDREAVLDQVVEVARTIEAGQGLLVSPVDGAEQVFVPAALIVPGPPRAGAAERRQAERFVRACYLDRYPVTNAQFQRFAEATGYQTVAEQENASQGLSAPTWRTPAGPASDLGGRENHPVVWVTRADATAYACWAGRRLPTRLEWERAMRGVAGQAWPWGAQFDPARCNLASTGTSPVDAYPGGASPAGCLDMVGNVWEWLADDLPGGRLLLMGGSWAEDELKAGYKQLVVPEDGTDGATGFRCAMDVPA